MEIKVLDKGFVRLESSMGDDTSIVRSARVSYSKGTKTKRSDEGLINYLMRNQHTSPFEAVVFTFHVKAPLVVFRQHHRHRVWSYNEISARYSEMKDEFYIPDISRIKGQDSKNRQASGENLDPEIQRAAVEVIKTNADMSFEDYKILLDLGVARELARMVLPVNIYSEMYATVNLKNLMDFIRQRDDDHAQWEIREYAKAYKEIARTIAPIAMSAFDEYVVGNRSSYNTAGVSTSS